MSDDIDDDQDLLRHSLSDLVEDGAAADSAEADRLVMRLPRLLRYAFLVLTSEVRIRIEAEIVALLPTSAELVRAWREEDEGSQWRPFAHHLDHCAVVDDTPALRTLADAVRLSSMEVRDIANHPEEGRRVLAALTTALYEIRRDPLPPKVLAHIETMIVGWAYLISISQGQSWRSQLAHIRAHEKGSQLTKFLRAGGSKTKSETATKTPSAIKAADEAEVVSSVPPDHVRVCPPIDTKATPKAREVCRGHEHVIGEPLPLVEMPDLIQLRRTLLFEFPYAQLAVDSIIAPLIGRRLVSFPPVVLVGPPGAGKSRLARRFAESLGVGLWRTDGARADGAVFGGTDRRWYTAEPCHAFLAISRARIANPLVLIDEIEKAATRSDYGRLWDSLLPFLEQETAAAYPDPCLQVDLDLTHVSYIATANSLLPLPSPILDRLRVVEMPQPRAEDLPHLIAPLMLDALREQQLDERWAEPLAAAEIELLGRKWRGGSVRKLRRYLDVILRSRITTRILQ